MVIWRIPTTSLCVLVLAVIGLVVAAPVGADTISTSPQTVPPTLTDWGWTPLTFPRFDPSQGTLTQVDLTLSAAMTTTFTLTNNGESDASGTAYTDLEIFVEDAGYTLTPCNLSELLGLQSGQLAVDSTHLPTTDLAPSEEETYGPFVRANNFDSSPDYTAPTILNEFTGTGNITLNAGAGATVWLDFSGGNVNYAQTTVASLTATVTYVYTPIPVPEPSTLALLAVGALGVVGYRWRRRAV
jgi:hypothetical protein